MKAYIAGPMTGYVELNYPAFEAAARQLRHVGLEVCSPHELNPKEGRTWQECMVIDIKEMLDCEMIITLQGWEKSKGANLEVHIAQELGKRVIALDECLNSYEDVHIEAVA